MSSYSFSHQFYQHWTGAPKPVRAAIVQELTDITVLLQTETEFESFVFSTHDLDAHLDDLYYIYDLQQATIQRQADEQAAEQQKLEEQKQLEELENDAKEKQRQQAEQQQAERQQIEALAYSENAVKNNHIKEDDYKQSNSEDIKSKGTQNKKATTVTNPVNAVANNVNTGSAINLTLKATKLSADHEKLVSELESHIDDYLTDQMLKMSENLKSWLRAEVSRQLTDKQQGVDDKEKS